MLLSPSLGPLVLMSFKMAHDLAQLCVLGAALLHAFAAALYFLAKSSVDSAARQVGVGGATSDECDVVLYQQVGEASLPDEGSPPPSPPPMKAARLPLPLQDFLAIYWELLLAPLGGPIGIECLERHQALTVSHAVLLAYETFAIILFLNSLIARLTKTFDGVWEDSLLPAHYSLLTTHHSLPTTHYSPLTTHCSLLTSHYSILNTQYSILTTTHNLLLTTTHYSPLTTDSLPLTTHYSLPTTHYLLLTTHYSLPTTHYLLLATYYSLPITHYLLLTQVWEDSNLHYHLSFAKLVLAMKLQPVARLSPGIALSVPFEAYRTLLAACGLVAACCRGCRGSEELTLFQRIRFAYYVSRVEFEPTRPQP